MPSVFKALASISVWILFFVGCSWIIDTFIQWAVAGFGAENWQASVAGDALGITAIILSVVAIKIRNGLE